MNIIEDLYELFLSIPVDFPWIDSGWHLRMPLLPRMENSFGLVQSDSMDLQNDPRFFQDNVLNKRCARSDGNMMMGVVGFLKLGYPNGWLVYFMDNSTKVWMMTGGTPHFRKPPCQRRFENEDSWISLYLKTKDPTDPIGLYMFILGLPSRKMNFAWQKVPSDVSPR